MKYGVATALIALRPDSTCTVIDDDYDKIIWYDESNSQPTETEINNKIAALDSEEPKRLLRIERDRLLSECDWTRVDDNGLSSSKKTEWATYRQALRDLPTSANPTLDPLYELNFSSVTWPTKPS